MPGACDRGPRDDALGVNIESGAFHCFRCGWKGRAGGEWSAPRPIARIDDPAVVERKRERLRRIWKETVSLNHADARAVRTYLESRALGEILPGPAGGAARSSRPCLFGQVDEPRHVSRHGRAIPRSERSTGHASCDLPAQRRVREGERARPKKTMEVPVKGATKGGAIHLYEPRAGVRDCRGHRVGPLDAPAAEVPVWSARCAENLAAAQLPTGLRELHIGIDVDASGKGEQVAQSLAKRVRRFSPPHQG